MDGLHIQSQGIPQYLHGLVLLLYLGFEGEHVGPVFVIFLVGVSHVSYEDGELLEGGERILGDVSQFGQAERAEQSFIVLGVPIS